MGARLDARKYANAGAIYIYFTNSDGSFSKTPSQIITSDNAYNMQDQFGSSCLGMDINNDGYTDIIISGNMYNSEVETPRNDGSVGVYLEFDPINGFRAVPTKESGLFINGDVKDMELISLKENDYIISAKNDDLIEFTRIK